MGLNDLNISNYFKFLSINAPSTINFYYRAILICEICKTPSVNLDESEFPDDSVLKVIAILLYRYIDFNLI